MSQLKSGRKVARDPAFIEHAEYQAKLAGTGNRIAAQYLLCLTVLTVVMVLLLLGSDRLWIQLLFAAVVFLIPWHHSAAILFFLVQASLFIHEGRIGLAKIDYNPWIVSLLTLVFVACADRFRTAWRAIGDGSIRGLRVAAFSLGESQPNSGQHAFAEDASAGSMLKRILKIIGAALVAVCIAAGLLILLPERADAKSEIRLAPQELRAISVAVFVLLLGVFASHVVSAVFWRWLSPLQARVYLNSTVNQWLRPEGRAISLRELNRRRRTNKTTQRK